MYSSNFSRRLLFDRWNVSDWSECSTSCDRGQQTRTVECKQRISAVLSVPVTADRCIHEPRPPTVRTCNVDRPCVRWRVGNWSQVRSTIRTSIDLFIIIIIIITLFLCNKQVNEEVKYGNQGQNQPDQVNKLLQISPCVNDFQILEQCYTGIAFTVTHYNHARGRGFDQRRDGQGQRQVCPPGTGSRVVVRTLDSRLSLAGSNPSHHTAWLFLDR